MPKKDGTGSHGMGPLTGCGSGKCIVPLNTTEEELNYLKSREQVLREQLRHIEARTRILEVLAGKNEKRA